jgi:SET domain-containing protein
VALRDIAAGEELGYDYAIELDVRHTPAAQALVPVRCGAARRAVARCCAPSGTA